MRWLRSFLVCLWSGLLSPGLGLAQDIDAFIYSDQPGGGALVSSGYDFSVPNPIFLSFCAGGVCLYTTSDPGFRTPDVDQPGDSLFTLAGGTDVRFEIVAIDEAASVQVGGVILDAPGESASLGSATAVHIHPLFQAVVPGGETGQYPIAFKFTGAGYGDSPTYELLLSNEPAPSPSPAPSPTATPNGAVDTYLLYKVKPSRLDLEPDNHRFPRDFNVNLDDVLLANEPEDDHPDDPENYTVKSAGGLLNPAMVDGEAVAAADVHYLRYGLKESKEGVGPVDSGGNFPKAVKAPGRLVEVENRLGTLFVETGSVAALLLPAGSSALGVPTPVGDQTHYVCHKAKASKQPSEQAPDGEGKGKGSFRKDLQVFAKDVFDDCADWPEGGVSFPGTSVEGTCLLDLKPPRLFCSPAAKSAVEPPRVTTAVVDESLPSNVSQSLLCYGAKVASKVRSQDAAALSGAALDEKVVQAKHVQRSQKAGTAVQIEPSNGFPSPVAVDTKALELVCLPTDVWSSTNLE